MAATNTPITLPYKIIEIILSKIKSWNSRNKNKNTTIITLPHEIIENILSRIPVKYLCRFKSVCKEWNSTISSDPTFAEIHLQQQSKNLLAWEEKREFKGFYINSLQQNGTFRFVSAIEHPWHEDMAWYGIDCYCHGLYLKPYDDYNHVLWNPSTRSYRKLSCPYLVDYDIFILYGICYNPLTKDYKVVIADTKHYAVFSCRNDEWSEVKEMDICFSDYHRQSGISINGYYYWILTDHQGIEEGDGYEIICFDSRDEELKKVSNPDIEVGVNDLLDLASHGGHLCLLVMVKTFDNESMKIMKKDHIEDAWMEFKVIEMLRFDLSYSLGCACSINEDEIIIDDNYKYGYQLYNMSNDTYNVDIRRPHSRMFSRPIPYQENLICL